MEIAGSATRGAHDHIAWPTGPVDGADDLALADRWTMIQVIEPLDFRIPVLVKTPNSRRILSGHIIVAQGGCQFVQRTLRIGHYWKRRMLEGVKLGHVDVDEAHVFILKSSLGRGGEVGIACADADDEIRLASQDVRPGGASDAD